MLQLGAGMMPTSILHEIAKQGTARVQTAGRSISDVGIIAIAIRRSEALRSLDLDDVSELVNQDSAVTAYHLGVMLENPRLLRFVVRGELDYRCAATLEAAVARHPCLEMADWAVAN